MTDVNAQIPQGNMDVRAVIVRACSECGAKREVDKDCEDCGLKEPAETVDLGLIAAHRTGTIKSAWWNTIGTRLADRRIHKANKELCDE